MARDDLDVDAIVRECHAQAQMAGMVDNPGNMFHSVITLAEEVKDLQEQNRRLWNAAQRVINERNTTTDIWESVPVSTLEDLRAAMIFARRQRRGNESRP